jgi:hypothetical protein
MPKQYQLPPDMEDAIILEELHISLDELDNYPESLLNNRLLYKAIKEVSINGGNLQL